MVRIARISEFTRSLPGRGMVLTALVLVALSLLQTVPVFAVGQVGEPAADFTLQDSNPGDWHTLSDYRGNVVVLFMIGYL